MQKFTLFLFLLFCSGCTELIHSPEVLELPIPKSYTIKQAESSPIIDGLANEESWNSADWTDLFIDIEGEQKPAPYYNTRVKMLWDDQFIYFYAEMEEEHIWGDITERDAVIFYNNDFEIFIKPNQFQPFYAEFEVNALGTLWDLFLARPYRRNGPILDHWDLNGTQVGIDINGTLNNPNDTDDSWSVEMAIPISPLKDIDRGSKLEVGSIWRINFSRVQWKHQITHGKYEKKTDSSGDLLSENNWVWTQQSDIDMHRPEHWGYVYFADKQNSKIEEDPFLNEYQLLFHLYRKQLEWKVNHDRFSDNIRDFGGPDFIINDIPLQGSVNSTKLGFEITVTNANKNSLTINQNGFIITSS